jgi:hypothetical protein
MQQTDIHFWSYLSSSQSEKCFRKKAAEKIKTHIQFSFLFQNRAVYGIMWENIVQPDRPQMVIWRMRIACWKPKARNMASEYVIRIAFPLQQQLHERATILLYMYIACLGGPKFQHLYIAARPSWLDCEMSWPCNATCSATCSATFCYSTFNSVINTNNNAT